MKPRIAVDVDGVLADSDGPLCHEVNKRLEILADPKHCEHYFCVDDWVSEKVEDSTEFIGSIFWKDGFLRELPVYLNALPAMKRLAGIAKEVHIVTARNTVRNPTCKEQTKFWLDKYGFVYDKIAYTEEKAEYCRIHQIKYIVDDAPHQAEACAAAGIGVFLINKPYNQKVVATGKNGIWRVDLMTEIPPLLMADL